MPKNGFTFFRSYYEAIRELEAEQRLELYDAITAYALDGVEPELSGVAKACFLLMRPVLDKSDARSQARIKGESKQDKPCESVQSSAEETVNKPESNAEQNEIKPESNAEQTPKDKDIGYRIKDKDRDNGITPLTSPQGGSAPDQPEEPPVEAPRRRKPSILNKTQEMRFNRFWAAYPRKVSIADAEKAWAKISPDEDMTQTILSAVERAKRFDNRFRDPQFIPHPATWLNAQSWRNEYGERAAVAQPYTPRAPSKPNALDILNDMLSEGGGSHDSG